MIVSDEGPAALCVVFSPFTSNSQTYVVVPAEDNVGVKINMEHNNYYEHLILKKIKTDVVRHYERDRPIHFHEEELLKV